MSSDDYGFDELDSVILQQVAEIEAAHAASTFGASTLTNNSSDTSSPKSQHDLDDSPSSYHASEQILVNSRRSPSHGRVGTSTSPKGRSKRLTDDEEMEVITIVSSPAKPPTKGDISFDDDEFGDLDDADLANVDEIFAAYAKDPVSWKPQITRQTTLTGGILDQSEAGPSKPQSYPFGKKAAKTKIWDRTAFAKTGRKTRKKMQNIDDREEDADSEVEFEQFPAPFVSVGYVLKDAPPMKLRADLDAAQEWIYPLNKPKRDYQYNIIRNCLFQNTLVALPTGLGKTFIAGVVMLNYYKWFPAGKIVFLAPTKPLVAQQLEALQQACGIPQEDAVVMTGDNQAARGRHWEHKRVFYMTPQSLQNDLDVGRCDPSDIVLVVFDEAHRATGDYAYCKVVQHMMAKNPHFRVLALTATPSTHVEKIQGVIDSLHISHIELRNDESLDLRQYIHEKQLVNTVVPINGEVGKLRAALTKVMQKEADKLAAKNILFIKDVVKLHPYRCQMAAQQISRSGDRSSWASVNYLGQLASAMAYLMEQSIKMCYQKLRDVYKSDPTPEDLGLSKKSTKKPSAKKKNSRSDSDPLVKQLMGEFERQKTSRGGLLPLHPKLDKLLSLCFDHFSNGDADQTRIMVFSTFRTCVEEMVDILNEHSPILRATRFVGQGTDTKGQKGMSQKEQLEVINKFKEGTFNILVATSIGEEGLDIGDVDLIICYDSQKTPIRMLQRMGRTGRKRAGRIEILSAEGREEFNQDKAEEKHKEVEHALIQGIGLELYADVERLLPDGVKPTCVEKMLDIPDFVVEQEGRKKRKPKPDDARPAKKLKRNAAAVPVPEGAASGFIPVNELLRKGAKGKAKAVTHPETGSTEEDSDDLPGFEELAGPRKASSSRLCSGPPSAPSVRPTGFISALDIAVGALDDSDDEMIERGLAPTSPPIPRKRLPTRSEPSDLPGKYPAGNSSKRKYASVTKGSSSSKSPRDVNNVDSPIVIMDSPETDRLRPDTIPPNRIIPQAATLRSFKSNVPAPTSDEDESMDWLLDDDCEDRSLERHNNLALPPPKASAARTFLQGGVKRSQPGTPFQPPGFVVPWSPPNVPSPVQGASSQREGHVARSQKGSGNGPGREIFTTPHRDNEERADSLAHRGVSSPGDSSFELRRPRRRLHRPPPPRVILDSDDEPQQEVHDVPEQIASLSRSGPSLRRPKHQDGRLLARMKNAMFAMEADHSGEDMSEGERDDNDEDGEDEYDRSFIKDFAPTQLPPGYNQFGAYRQGLLTQAPGGGPTFEHRPIRIGMFRAGLDQRSQDQGRRRAIPSSSPGAESYDEELDQYELGSFVVEDDDDALLRQDLSSEG